MKDLMITLGVILTSVIVLAIPILLVCSLYEHWPKFITFLLFMFMIGDLLAVSSGVVVAMEDFE